MKKNKIELLVASWKWFKMEKGAYLELSKQEDHGWYYAVRREIILWSLKKYTYLFRRKNSENIRILDIGCGTGGSSLFFAKFGNVTGIDTHAEAIQMAREKYSELKKDPSKQIHECNFIHTSIEEFLEQAVEKFDLILILGVLYHRNISSPPDSLRRVVSFLKQDGVLVWNEAAHRELWRSHDVFVHGGRRFAPEEMKNISHNINMKLDFDFPLLCWAYPIAWIEARWTKIPYGVIPSDKENLENSEIQSSPNEIHHSFLNLIFKKFEWNLWHLCRMLRFPFKGVSHTMILSKL